MAHILVGKELREGETRVAATPETIGHYIKAGHRVSVEAGAGVGSFIDDAEYIDAGAEISTETAWSTADLVLNVHGPEDAHGGARRVARLKEGAALVAFMAPHANPQVVEALAQQRVSCLAMELVPRTTRAQKMDALSSQASIAGYKAVLCAATHLPRYFPMLMTAAGTVKPARIVVMGAGVAGLQAIATAKRLGAVVEASDIRPAVKEQVESLGGRFIDLPKMEESGEGEGGYARSVSAEFLERQQAIVAEHLAQADAVITTALVPGKPAPRLVSKAMVERMKKGAVIVDLAVEQGGNCELSSLLEAEVRHAGVLILGCANLPGTMPVDASMLYARNVSALVELVAPKGELSWDLEDEIIAGTLLTHGGKILHGPTRDTLAAEEAKERAS